jgi:hypothetical protein
MGIFLSLPRCDRGESKLLPLLGPAKRNMLVEVFELQHCRLTSLQNGFDDIRGQERACQHVSHVVRCQVSFSRQRLEVDHLAIQDFLAPYTATNNSLDQCGSGMLTRRRSVGLHDKMKSAVTTLPFHFNAQTDRVPTALLSVITLWLQERKGRRVEIERHDLKIKAPTASELEKVLNALHNYDQLTLTLHGRKPPKPARGKKARKRTAKNSR